MSTPAVQDEVKPGARDLAKVPYLVVNPNSASGSTGRGWAKFEAAARAALGDVAFGRTTGPMHAAQLAREALEAGHRRIIAVGGDGTLNEVINGFFKEDGTPVAADASIGLLPRGTGGDFKRTAKIPEKFEEALAGLATAVPRRIDVGVVRFRGHAGSEVKRYFINVASVGVSGAVDVAVHESKLKWLGGRLSFMLASLKALWGYRDGVARLSVDGGTVESVKVTALAMANGQFFGGGMWVAPEAKLDDGLLHCTLWSGYTLWDFIFRSGGIYSGEHVKWAKTRCFSAKQVTVESDVGLLLDIDGEQPGTVPATFEVVPSAVGLLA